MLKPLKKKQQRPLPYSATDLELAKSTADMHYKLFETRRCGIANPDTEKDSYEGYMIENQFYSEVAYNAVHAIENLADIAHGCSSLREDERIMMLLETQQKLQDMTTLLENFIQNELDDDSINFRTPSLGKAHILSTKALQKIRGYLTVAQNALKPARSAAPKI